MSALSYRAYLLKNVSQQRSLRRNGKVRTYTQRMELKLAEHYFSEKDPIFTNDFLTRFVREANIQETSKAQAFAALPSFLRKFARIQYEAGAEMILPEEGDFSGLPQAVQYPSKNYAQSWRISSALSDFRAVFQGPTETEGELFTRLIKTICRCRYLHHPEGVLSL